MVDDIAKALEGTEFIGTYDAISEPASFSAVAAVMDKSKKSAPVASALPYDSPTEQFAPKFGKMKILWHLIIYLIFISWSSCI